MRDESAYTGIDFFRLIAAFIVITIHTSPLSSMNGTADFILTRVFARVAVPFFFMVSGFFLFRDNEGLHPNKLRVFLKRTAALCGIASLLYLPLSIYAGIAGEWLYLPNLLKAILFDGTFYHLWYFPAAAIGAAAAWLLLRHMKVQQAFAVSLVLYIVGLFGDSYYGVAEQIPILKGFYQAVFLFSSYTRNGLFFAPVFFILGALMAKETKRPQMRCLVGLSVSMGLMLAEGLLLHRLEVQKHDSMYFMLVPCMVFLFQSLLLWKGKRLKSLRDLAVLIYLIHPLMIVLVRGFAKITALEWLLIDNSMVHFLAVLAGSLAAAIAADALLRKRRTPASAPRPGHRDRAWAEINMPNLRHNVQILRRALPDRCELMAVVKANAYGHGGVEVSTYLNQIGVRAFAVATIDEGIDLRKQGIQGTILVLGYTVPQRASDLVHYQLSQTVVDAEHAESLNRFGKPIQVHIKVDTGMHRLGEDYSHVSEIERIFQCKNLHVDGIFTHLCVSDSLKADDTAFTKAQIQGFYQLLEELRRMQITLPKVHIQSSYGVLNYPELQCDYARIGIALYGVLSTPGAQTRLSLDLRPVLELKSKVALVRTIEAGESVGYGRQFVAPKETRIAVVPVGYADGLPRSLSMGKSYALIRGSRTPVIGLICMDQLMVDITALPGVEQGDIVTLIGQDDAEEISAEQAAKNAGTITNELLSRLGHRLERVFRYS